jgi:hypothetical protein
MKKLKFIVIIICISISYCLSAQNNATDTLPTKIPYQWVSYQAKIDLTFEKTTQHCQLFFVNRIDSIIYLNLNFSGIELGRMVLTPDSILFVNKIEGSYYRGDYALLRNLLMLDFDFYMIQSVFNGVDFPHFTGQPTVVIENGLSQFIFSDRIMPMRNTHFQQEIKLNNSNCIAENRFEDLTTRNQAIIHYSDYADIDSVFFFNNLIIKQEEKQFELKAALRKVKFNVIGPTGITISAKFSEIKFD